MGHHLHPPPQTRTTRHDTLGFAGGGGWCFGSTYMNTRYGIRPPKPKVENWRTGGSFITDLISHFINLTLLATQEVHTRIIPRHAINHCPNLDNSKNALRRLYTRIILSRPVQRTHQPHQHLGRSASGSLQHLRLSKHPKRPPGKTFPIPLPPPGGSYSAQQTPIPASSWPIWTAK